jgi:hypothetical protein
MTTQHTPGPWRYQDVRSQKEHVYFRIEAKDGAVGFAYKHNNDEEANARLIAAAPDLLAALEGLLAGSERHIFHTECQKERDAASAAIARAKGE